MVAILNPAAGGGKCGRRAEPVLAELRGAGVDVDVRCTQKAGDGMRLAKEAREQGHHRFLAVGGDGTSYEVLNGVLSASAQSMKPEIGIIPLGTGNSFLRDFNVRSAQDALASVLQRRKRPVDVIEVVHAVGLRYALNIVSLGFAAEVGELTNRYLKRLGPLGYIAAVLWKAGRLSYPTFAVHAPGDRYTDARPATMLAFSNSRFTGGGMEMAPDADPTDGEVDLVRIGVMSGLDLLRCFPSIYRGQHLLHPRIESRRAARFDLDLDRAVDVMIDGEVERLQLRHVRVLPGAVECYA